MNRETPTVKRVRVAAVVVLLILVASCSASTSDRESAIPADSTAATSTTTSAQTPPSTQPPIDVDWQAVESTASGFMVARQDRDVTRAQAYLDEDVLIEWGPNDGHDGLAAAWAWEDAFKLTQTLQECVALTDGDESAARCRLRVDSEVAEAAGHEAGFVCIDITVDDGQITRVNALDSANGCNYNYWAKTFQPFSTWLAGAHPDTTIDEMYRDRVSTQGLNLWRRYTDEYIADHSS